MNDATSANTAFIFRFAIAGNDKIDLDIVLILFFTVMRIEEKTMTVSDKHLCNGIFVKHKDSTKSNNEQVRCSENYR